jgi:hypothetical protein
MMALLYLLGGFCIGGLILVPGMLAEADARSKYRREDAERRKWDRDHPNPIL